MYAYNFLQKDLIKSTLASLLLLSLNAQAGERTGKYLLAEKISSEALQSWDISIFPDGKNLPEGKGDHKTGKVLYEKLCLSCHGENGKGGIKLDPYRGAIETLVKDVNDTLTSDAVLISSATYHKT